MKFPSSGESYSIWHNVVFFFCLFSSISYAQQNQLENITLQLKWKYQFQFAGYIAAKEKGFFAEEGLNVTLKEMTPGMDHLQAVIEGQAEYGISDAGLLLYRSKGKPVVLLLQIFQHSPLIFISRKDSGIISPYEMVGKKVMYQSLGANAALEGMLLETLGDLSKVQLIPHSMNYDDLFDGKVDVMSAYITDQTFKLKEQGKPINIINPQNYGVDYYGDNLFTTDKELLEHPGRADKMIRATLKGWEYALEHKTEIIDIILEKYAPDLKRSQLEFEAKMTEMMILKDLISIGDINPHRFEKIAEIYAKLKQISNRNIPSGFFYRPNEVTDLSLSTEEMAWIKGHPEIKLGFASGLEPLLIDPGDSQLIGMLPDCLDMLNKKLGSHMTLRVLDQEDILREVREKNIDGVPGVGAILANQSDLLRTKPLTSFFPTVFVRSDPNLLVTSLEDLVGKTVAVTKDSPYSEILLRPYKDKMAIIEFDSSFEAMESVFKKKADAMLGLSCHSFLISKYFFSGITPALVFRENKVDVVIGVREDWPDFVKILNKEISNCQSELSSISEKWSHESIRPDDAPVFSAEEKAWLSAHPVFRVAIDSDWAPVEYLDKTGTYQGMSIDFLNIVAKKLNVAFEVIRNHSWDELIEMGKNKEVDIFSGLSISEERKQYFYFTTPYHVSPVVIFANTETPFIGKLDGLHGKKVAMVGDHGFEKTLFRDHPTIEFVIVENIQDGLNKLIKEEVFAYLGSLFNTSYHISRASYSQIKVAGETPYSYSLGLSSRKDWPLLNSILEKTLASISESEINEIYSKWTAVKYEHKFDYILLWKILGAGLFIIALFIFWNLKLKSEIKKQTSALLQSEQEFRNLYFNAQVALVRTSFGDGQILECNGIFAKMVGFENREECKCHYVFSEQYVVPGNRQEIKETLLQKGKVDHYVTQIYKRDRTPIWIEFSATLNLEDGYIEVVVLDITERKKDQDALKESERNYRLLADNAADVIWTMNHELHFTFVSPSIKDLSGYSSEEALSEPLEKQFSSSSLEKLLEILETSKKMNSPLIFEAEQFCRDGSKIWVELSIKNLKDEMGNHIGFVGTSRNIKERKKALAEKKHLEHQIQQKQKMESIGTLAGGIAHDFNNILAAIFGYAELVKKSLKPESSTFGMQAQVIKAANRAKDLVNQILLFSRRADQEMISVHIHLIVKEALELLRVSIPASIEFKTEIRSDCGCILADATQIHQIIMNLCTNSYYAMKEKGGVLSVTLSPVLISEADMVINDIQFEPGQYIKLNISDTGYGMDPQTIEKAFNPYFTTKPKGEGTGLGLSVVHGIVKSYGGHIEITSESGKGTSVDVFFPKHDVKDGAVQKDIAQPPPSGHERILVVDDEEMITGMMTSVLESLGYQVAAHINSLDALSAFKTAPFSYDLVITDMAMPLMTGLELTENLLKIRPDIPVILFTGFSDQISEEKTLALGIRKYLKKPIVINDLARSIRSIFDENR